MTTAKENLIARSLFHLKNDCKKALQNNKTVSIISIVNILKAIGIYVEKTGKNYKFQVEEEVYFYNAAKKNAAKEINEKIISILEKYEPKHFI